MRVPFRLSCLLAAAVLAGCSSSEPEEPADAAPEGRAETRSIRNTEAVGYDGNAIADKVDGALDATEKRKEQGDREAEEQTQ